MTENADDNWVKEFSVSDPKTHHYGFTIYKVTSVVFRSEVPEIGTKIIVWKRYREFRKLHHEISKKHAKLHLQGKVPSFPSRSFFKRFNYDVIEKRRKCACELLKFIGSQPLLFASDIFKNFLESGYCDVGALPSRARSSPSQGFTEENLEELPEDASFQAGASCENDASTSDGVDDLRIGFVTSLNSSALVQLEESSDAPCRDEVKELLLDIGEEWVHPPDLTSTQSSEECTVSTREDITPNNNLEAERPSDSLERAPEANAMDVEVNRDDSLDSLGSVPSTLPHSSLNPNHPDEILNTILHQALVREDMATSYEQRGEALRAQETYRYAIECLLEGIQGVKIEEHKQKINFLIQKYRNELKILNGVVDGEMNSEPSGKYVSRMLTGLGAFKVLGIIAPKVVLVMNTEDFEVYAVKFLYRSSYPLNKNAVPILPYGVPGMVKLCFYFETESTVFLFLQYASGGRLKDRLQCYLQSKPSLPVNMFPDGNFYVGRRLIPEPCVVVKNCSENAATAAVSEAVQKGHLVSFLKTRRETLYKVPEKQVRIWAEQIILCLDALHESGLIFRYLCPRNLLLSEDGKILLSYCCNWPNVDPEIDTGAISKLYAAPETLSVSDGITPAADWWSLGAILYEFISGESLRTMYPWGVQSHTAIKFPDGVSREARSLISELLKYYPKERLGSGATKIDEILSHPFFAESEWTTLTAVSHR